VSCSSGLTPPLQRALAGSPDLQFVYQMPRIFDNLALDLSPAVRETLDMDAAQIKHFMPGLIP